MGSESRSNEVLRINISRLPNPATATPMPAALPPRPARSLAERILRVNHAGENGAVHIYTGQLLVARWTAPAMVDELKTFKGHEERHRALFQAELQRRGVRRCRSFALCGLGGFVLGLTTGLLGPSAIAATTVAVERVVLGHLQHQLLELRGQDAEAVAAIDAIVEEEQAHHDASAAHAPASGFWHRVLSPVVAGSTEAVIWMGMRL